MEHIFRVCDSNGTVLRTINAVKSVKYHVQGGERNVLKFGNAFASSIEVEYYTLSQPNLSVGDVIRYVQHFDNSLTDFETPDPKDMVINYFWVDSFQKGAKTCKFVAYDVVTKLSVDYSARLLAIKSNFPMTVNDLVNDIKTYLGFSTIQMFMSGDLHDAVLQYFYVDGITAREILGQIAELNGGNLFGLTTLSNGTLAYNILSQSFLAVNVYNITNSAYTSDYIIAPTDQEEYYVSGVLKTPVFYKQGGLEVGENDISPIDKVVIKKADGTELAYYPLSSPETNVLEIRNNIIAQNIISINSPFPHENLTNNLYQAARSVSTRPIVTAKLFPFRFPFVCYAIIYFVDIDDTIKQFPIMNLEWTDEAVIIESFGSAIVSRDEESYSSTQDQTNTTISTVNRLEVDKLDKFGDTMTGDLNMSEGNLLVIKTNADLANPPVSSNNYGVLRVVDQNGTGFVTIRAREESSGTIYVQLGSTRQIGGTTYANILSLGVDSNGNRVIGFSSAVPWREALGIGTSGAFPITIAQGGTGATVAHDALVNLGGRDFYESSQLSANGTINIKTSGYAAFVLYASAFATARNGAWLVTIRGTSYTPIVTALGTAPTGITLTTNVNGELTATTNGAVYFYVQALRSNTMTNLTITTT